jgi:hypothetical protein
MARTNTKFMNNLLRSQSAVLCAHSLPVRSGRSVSYGNRTAYPLRVRLPEWYVSSLVAPRLASCPARYGSSINFIIFQEKYYE